MNWFVEHLLAPIAVVFVATIIPRVRPKVREGATATWHAMASLLRLVSYWVTAGTKERRDARFAKRVKAAQRSDIEMLGDAIDAHGLALSALHTVIATMLLPEEVANGKKYLPKHAKMLAWFMLYRYLSHDTDRFDMSDRSISAYRKKHSDKAPGRWRTNLDCHSNDRFSTEFIDQMNGGPLRFNREMDNGKSLNIKIVQGFCSKLSGHPQFKCHVWDGSIWHADEGPELGLEEAYRKANAILTIGGGWKEQKQ